MFDESWTPSGLADIVAPPQGYRPGSDVYLDPATGKVLTVMTQDLDVNPDFLTPQSPDQRNETLHGSPGLVVPGTGGAIGFRWLDGMSHVAGARGMTDIEAITMVNSLPAGPDIWTYGDLEDDTTVWVHLSSSDVPMVASTCDRRIDRTYSKGPATVTVRLEGDGTARVASLVDRILGAATMLPTDAGVIRTVAAVEHDERDNWIVVFADDWSAVSVFPNAGDHDLELAISGMTRDQVLAFVDALRFEEL